MGKRSPKIAVTCPCSAVFEVTQARLDAGRGRQCSVECRRKYITRPSGLNYTLHKENPTWFKPGHVPWSKGMKRGPAWNTGLRGTHFSPDTEFKMGERVGEANPKWRGDDVGYQALHTWVSRHKTKPDACEWCNTTGVPIDWANKSHEYHRDLADWLALCKPCHGKHDSGKGYGAMVRKYGRSA